MRWILIFSIVTFLLLGLVKSTQGQVDVGISVGEEGLRGFYLAIGEYFKIPEREVVIIHERYIPDNEIPVVFFIAGSAQVSPDIIVDLRLGGESWWDISIHFGVSPEIFYVPVEVEIQGPPYGKAYGYFKKMPRKEWGTIVLTDEEIVSLVNLKFISEHYQYPPERIIEMKSSGMNFVMVNDAVTKEKGVCGKQRGKKEKENTGKKNKR